MDKTMNSLRVLMFPYLAHGHISPFLELARKLKDRNFEIHFCSTPVNLKSISKKLADYSIQPVELHLPSSPELPPEYHTTNGLPPHLTFALSDALQKSGPALSDILKSVQPDLVIYDIAQPWLPPIAADQGVPAVYFQTTGAMTVSFFLRAVKYPDVEFPSPGINLMEPKRTSFRRAKLPSNTYQDKAQERFFKCLEQSNEIILVKSSREFEGKYIDFYSSLASQEIVPVGGLVREPEEDADSSSEIIQWLDERQEASTVYVSFGSECFLSKEEIQAIALGLELSTVNFIWVVRAPDGEKTSLEQVLPEGFLDRVSERGLLLEKWAPQARILKHQSTGGFISHCGWGSLMESVSFGVPIIAMPMQYDQPMNAKLVVETGVGLEVVKGVNGRLEGEEIARIIKQVLVEDAGAAIRRKAKEVAEKVRGRAAEEIDVAVQELTRICQKYKKH